MDDLQARREFAVLRRAEVIDIRDSAERIREEIDTALGDPRAPPDIMRLRWAEFVERKRDQLGHVESEIALLSLEPPPPVWLLFPVERRPWWWWVWPW